MTTRLTGIIILIGAAITWVVVWLLFGLWPALVFPFVYFPTAICLLILIWAGLISLRALAWAFILTGVFSLFFPFTLGGLDLSPYVGAIIAASVIPFILTFVGINFAFGVLSAIISFFKKKP